MIDPLIETIRGPHRRTLIPEVSGFAITPLRFVPVFDFTPQAIVGRPVDDWRAAAETMNQIHHGSAA